MRRFVLVTLIAGLALALGVLGGTRDAPAEARSSTEKDLSSTFAFPTQEQPLPLPAPPPHSDPYEEPIQGGTAGGATCCVLDVAQIYPPADGRAYINAAGFAGTNLIAPYRWIVRLRMTFHNGGVYGGTGFLIGPTTVITVGHNVYGDDRVNPNDPPDIDWAVSVDVTPGKDGVAGCPPNPVANAPFGCQTVTTHSLWTTRGYFANLNPCYDYGAIILDRPFPGMAGPFFAYAAAAAAELRPRLSGYPGDKGGNQQWFDDNFDAIVPDATVERITGLGGLNHLGAACPGAGGPAAGLAQLANYTLDTCPGHSGSPVWYPPANPHNVPHAPTVVAIHAYGGGTAPTACDPRVGPPFACDDLGGQLAASAPDGTRENCGRVINAAAMDNFDYWLRLNIHHYKCYDIFPPQDPAAPVTLVTQFGTENVVVRQSKYLCPPAVKTHNGIESGNGKLAHLKCYNIEGGHNPSVPVDLTTQFGAERVTVGLARELCVPVLKAIYPETPEGLPPPEPHYECYEIAGHTPNVPVHLETQFGPEDVVVGQAVRLCAPALKNGEGNLNWAHLKCYQISPPDDPPDIVNLRTQFTDEFRVDVNDSRLLCVQAEKLFPVGGITQLRAGPEPAAEASGSAAARDYAVPIAAAVAGLTLALAAGGWYARRRWLP